MQFIKKTEAVLLAAGIVLLSLTVYFGESSIETGEDVELIFDYEEELQYADRFTMTHYEDGYTIFTVPGVSADRQYLIVPEGKEIPTLPGEDTIVLQQPVTDICFASGSMASLAEAIGAGSCIKTVAIEKENWVLRSVIDGIDAGRIRYSGSFKNPDFELLLKERIQLEIDTTMLLNHSDIMEQYDELDIPYFIEDSTKESNPLGRIEWVKLLGAILGKEEEAARYFDEQTVKIKNLEIKEGSEKTVALFYMGENSFYVRNGGDYVTAMFAMAGGNDCMDINSAQGGSCKISLEEFYRNCKDADYLFWVILECPYDSLEEMIADNGLFADFKAVQNGRVYCTRRGFAQRTADFADVILEINHILNDPGIKETDTFVKLKEEVSGEET